ncbi:pheST operon leader peptide PheM [Escherichia coli]|nr:pheST operon leader peptide PheM [Escherichia coli]
MNAAILRFCFYFST